MKILTIEYLKNTNIPKFKPWLWVCSKKKKPGYGGNFFFFLQMNWALKKSCSGLCAGRWQRMDINLTRNDVWTVKD